MRQPQTASTYQPLRNCVVMAGGIATALACLLTHPPAALAQAPQAAPVAGALDEADVERARLLGLLVYTNITITLNDTPARDALMIFKQATGIPLVPRWADDALGFGLEPGARVSLTAQNQPALDVLEQILEQCEIYEDCTWQLRKGFVEVGTKERLSVPSARETRMYNIRDLMLEPPIFATVADTKPSERKYNSAFTGKRTSMVATKDDYTFRKNPDELADEIVVAVVETIEPGMWDVGEDKRPDSDESTPVPSERSGGAGVSGAGAASPASPAAPAAKQPRSRSGIGKWATLRVWRDQMIIKAPDFMHRQINGYPPPIMPEGGVRQVVADPTAVTAAPFVAPGQAAPGEGAASGAREAPMPAQAQPHDDGPPEMSDPRPGRPPSEATEDAPSLPPSKKPIGRRDKDQPPRRGG